MEMKEINKIVRLSDLQYEKLLKDRQIEVDSEIKVWEPDTLYVTPNNNYQWLFDKFYETVIKPNEVYHTPMNMKSLEQEYKYLTTENNNLVYVSAIGYTAILKNGDTIKVTEPNKGIFYINGSIVTNDYTYTGDGYEVVNVWVFEGKPEAGNPLIVPPQLNDTPTFNITELDVRNIAQTPVVGDSYKNYALTLKAYNFEISGLATRKLISNGTETFNQTETAATLEEVESDCTVFSNKNTSPLYQKTNLKKAIFPSLVEITQTTAGKFGFLNGCTNKDLFISFPNLCKIAGAEKSDLNIPFLGVKAITLPNSVRLVGDKVFYQNSTITLNCNRATFASNWCYASPTENFTMCEDWQADINIAVAAKNHTKDWFIDLFTNKLHDFSSTEETREICIPLAIFEAMTEDELALAKNKNWTVTGA